MSSEKNISIDFYLLTKLPSDASTLLFLFQQTITKDFDSLISKISDERTNERKLFKQIKEFSPEIPFGWRYHRRCRLPLCCVAFSLVLRKYKWYKYFGMPSGLDEASNINAGEFMWMKKHFLKSCCSRHFFFRGC